MVFLGLRGLRIDAVYSSTAQSQGLIASILSAIWHVPLIVDYGDPSFVRDAGLVRKIGTLLENISLNRSDAVISSDPVISRYAYSICGKTPILLPNGYDQDLFPSTTCHSQRSSSDRFVTFVGKIDTSVYRLDVLLLASKRVIDAIPETRFRLIGSGPGIAKLRHLASELGVQRSIDFVGPIPHNEVASWICESEVCVHMTNDTCLGMKVMEYMASGKPIVIAAPWWDKYDSVINSGLNCITVPLDPGALATAILRVMQDREYATYLGRNAQETASNRSWDEISETLIHVVWDLIRR
jgi:glycosyltransferase involved in cell wall biosynthesis